MHSSKRTRKRSLVAQALLGWKPLVTMHFKPDEKTEYERREKAVRLYAQNEPMAAIEEATGVCRQLVDRYVDRCMQTDSNGQTAGFAALVRYAHQEKSTPSSTANLSGRHPKPGNFQALLARYPSIYDKLFDYAVHGKRDGTKIPEINPPISAIHKYFVELCESAGVQSPHYPFNSRSKGKPAVRRWVAEMQLGNTLAQLHSVDPNAAASLKAVGSKDRSMVPVTRYYQRVQCDGHKIDYQFRIAIPSETQEGVIYKTVSRIWIIVLIEVRSRAVIGYSFSYELNYNATDVMRAVRNSLRPWRRRNLSIKTVDYEEGQGLPSGVVEGLDYACFDELCLDNAKAHLAQFFIDHLGRMVGAVPVFPPKAAPNSQPFVEGFFNILEEAGLHRMAGTTGSHAGDPRGNQQNIEPELRLTQDQLHDFIDLLISRINGHRIATSSLSRLEILKEVVTQRTCMIRRIPTALREDLLRYDMYESRSIGKDHRRPCVRFQGGVYCNDILAHAFALVGRGVLVIANSEDLRTVECVLDDGTHLGTLYERPQWRYTAHSLVTKREVTRLRNDGLDFPGKDLPREYRRHLEAEAKQSKVAAAKLTRVREEQGRYGELEEGDPELHFEEDAYSATSVPSTAETNSEPDYDPALEEAERLLANLRTIYR